MLLKSLLGILVPILLSPIAAARQYPVINYNIQEGLSHSNVFRIFQDKKGFLWFCTDYGLCRFNGKEFKKYFTSEGLPGHSIMSISEDDSGVKYISVYDGGLARMTDSTIDNIVLQEDWLPPKFFFSYHYHQALWAIGRDEKDLLLQIRDGKACIVQYRDSLMLRRGYHIDNHLFFATQKGIYKINDSDQLVPLVIPGSTRKQAISIAKDHHNNYWIAYTDELVCFSKNKITKQIHFSGRNLITGMILDRNDHIWIATVGNGVLLSKNTTASSVDFDKQNAIPDITINDLMEDNEGNIWIATHGSGVYKISALYIENYLVEQYKINAYCKSIFYADTNAVFIGSMGNISQFKHNVLFSYKCSLLGPETYVYFIQKYKNDILIGTPTGLIMKKTSSPFSEKWVGAEKIGALSFCENKGGAPLIGSYNCLYHFRRQKLIKDTARLTQQRRFNSILKASDGRIWLGTAQGILTLKDNAYTEQILAGGKPGNTINYLYEDSQHRIWAATDSGLACFANGQTIYFYEKDGLAHNKCNAICQDSSGAIWIGTLKGLCNTNVEASKIQNFIANIFPYEVLTLSYTHNDYLLAGTVNGFSRINLAQTRADRISLPPLYITAATVNDHSSPMPTSLFLNTYRPNLSIDYIALSYRMPEKIEYRYKILGLDKDWKTTVNHSLEISALPGGDYCFLVAARYTNGEWGMPARLFIHVPVPWWQKKVAVLGMIMSSIILIFLVSRFIVLSRERKKRHRLTLYNKIVYLKQQAASALINPHFIFNCMSSIQYFMHKNDKEKTNLYLTDFAALIRMTLDNVQKSFISLSEEIHRINLYLKLESLRMDEELEYSISIDPSLNAQHTFIPNMVVQPYVENSVWHGIRSHMQKGKITISILQDNEQLKITVVDNGIGIYQSQKRSNKKNRKAHYGLKLTAERLRLLQQLFNRSYSVTTEEIINMQGKTEGTQVIITLPLAYNESWDDN